MTIMLILGCAAALYVLTLAVRLATLALPFGCAICAAFWLRDAGYGFPAMIGAGFIAGVMVLVAARGLFAVTRSADARAMLALLFAAPAAIAGYYLMAGLLRLVMPAGPISGVISLVGAAVIALAAARQLSDARHNAMLHAPALHPERASR